MTSKIDNVYISRTCHILKDFCIKVDQKIIDKLYELYPNEIAIEQYTRKLILEKLEE